MTIPKSKSRNMVVNGKAFRWMLGSGKGRLIGMSGPGLVLTVQEDDPKPGRVMQMHIFSKMYAEQDNYNEEHTGIKTTLKPYDVKRAIDYALRNGWDPKAKGAPFKPKGPLDLDEYELSAPGTPTCNTN